MTEFEMLEDTEVVFTDAGGCVDTLRGYPYNAVYADFLEE